MVVGDAPDEVGDPIRFLNIENIREEEYSEIAGMVDLTGEKAGRLPS